MTGLKPQGFIEPLGKTFRLAAVDEAQAKLRRKIPIGVHLSSSQRVEETAGGIKA